jgi:hypothetical protein
LVPVISTLASALIVTLLVAVSIAPLTVTSAEALASSSPEKWGISSHLDGSVSQG